MLAAVATALLPGPVACHRPVFRRGQKERLVRAANVMAVLGLAVVGLAVVGLAVSASVLLVTGFVAGFGTGTVIAVLTLAMFGLLWFAYPLARR